jgi:hypothetical protein
LFHNFDKVLVGLHFGRFFQNASGVDVMITIFCDFCTIFGKKIGVFLKNQCYDHFFQNLALFWVKNANFFAKFFGENILKIITSVPGHPAVEVKWHFLRWLFLSLLQLKKKEKVGKWKQQYFVLKQDGTGKQKV